MRVAHREENRGADGADDPGLSHPPALTSLFLASPPSPRRLHQGELGNQINQKYLLPQLSFFKVGRVGEKRLYITPTISYLAHGVNRCKAFRGLTHWIRGGLVDYSWILGKGPAFAR